ncbi:MAG: DUF932 domain-containing protein [Phycisphaerales bacterium]|nr:DUF932 domain-containing protein [Phycisphaerales bacterium]
MAHEITSTDKFGHVGEKAWHGLGVKLADGLTPTEAFDVLGLGWETGLYEVPPLVLPDGRKVVAADNRMHVRMDTATCLGMVGKDYRPISNQEMAKFADILAGEDKAVRVETGGSLRGGKRTFVLIKLPKDTEVLDGDMLKNYVCISNGHDGINGFRVFFTSVRVVCANTLAMAEGTTTGARFAHDGDVTRKIELARASLGIIVKRSEAFAEQARGLAAIKLKKEGIADYFDRVYARTYGEDMSEKHTDEVLGLWNGNLSEARNTVRSTEGTAWHAFNAVSYYHDHQRGRFKDVAESEGRVHSNLFGASSFAKQIAFNEALALATE